MARDALLAVEDVLGPVAERSVIFDEPPAIDANVSDEQRVRLLGRYGADAAAVVARADLRDHIDGSVVTWGEVLHAATQEGVVKLEDLLLRRARLGLLVPQGGLAQMAQIRTLVQPALGWDDARWAAEEAEYRALWNKAYAGR
jgi:glycerol-3-phosphate dehydrogenase